MNILRCSASLFLLLALVGCAQQDDEPVVEELTLDSTEKRLSYGIAYGFGQRLRQDGVPTDIDAFELGLRHALDDVEPLMSEAKIGEEMQAYQQARNAALAEEALGMAKLMPWNWSPKIEVLIPTT